MASDNRTSRTSNSMPSNKGSTFSIENILNITNEDPQEGRKMDIVPAPHGLNSTFPLVVPPLLPQALRPPMLDYNVMFPRLHIQSPSFDDILFAHPFPALAFNMGYPHQGIPMSGLPRRKRFMRKPKQRPLFAHSQIQRLEKEFGEEKYLTEAKRAELSKDLGMTETQVKTWYQNRRTKWRKELKEELNSKAKSEESAQPWEDRSVHAGESSMLTAFERVQPHSSSRFPSKIQDTRMFIDLETIKPRFVYS